MTKFDDSDAKAKVLHAEAQKPTVALPEFEALDAKKRELDSRLEVSLKKIDDQDAQIKKLSDDFVRQTAEMEERQKTLKGVIANGTDASATVASLRTELSSLREQLTRQVTNNTAAKATARPEGGAFTMATGRGAENGAGANSGAIAVAGLMGSPAKRRQRRHSDVGTELANDFVNEDGRWDAPRAVSVAFPQESGVKRLPGGKTYLPDIYDDPAEEIMKLLEDEEPLDEDVLAGLIRHLKIPSPNLQNPPSPKEVLFPAHLISLVTNEMWKYGMMRESERFLANVMQTIQQHVMVRSSFYLSICLLALAYSVRLCRASKATT